MTIERALELLPQMRDSQWVTVVGQVTAIYTDEAKEAFNMAISALEKQEAIKSCTPPSDDWEHYADRLHDIAYRSGYEQRKKDAEQDRWIPVTERLPEKEGCYLVTVKNDHERRYSKTAWYCGDGWFARQDIIAWRLTPEPYTEEEA